ncbi:hypothetical protein H206_05313 [Candidatus Electrothrix aarhusensis]|uniref:Uncharacterized protein n=1 Tax=Candidatus Electrothrix aarhusensis TaxID=1859131 RepID=A0A3S3SR34_9BACT|nr:hypothetical protein H206_05313 [Candidatus Electrothrix aarhusensis]
MHWLGLDDLGDVGISRATMRGIILEAAVRRWVMGRGDDDAVTELLLVIAIIVDAIMGQDSMGDHRGRRVPELVGTGIRSDADLSPVGRKHLKCCQLGRPGQGMGIHAHKEDAVNTCLLPILADRLSHSQDVGLVEAAFQRTAAMPRGAEADSFGALADIRNQSEVGGDQLRDIN